MSGVFGHFIQNIDTSKTPMLTKTIIYFNGDYKPEKSITREIKLKSRRSRLLFAICPACRIDGVVAPDKWSIWPFLINIFTSKIPMLTKPIIYFTGDYKPDKSITRGRKLKSRWPRLLLTIYPACRIDGVVAPDKWSI